MSYIEKQNERRYEDTEILVASPKKSFRSILCGITVRGILGASIFAISVPLLIYYFVIDRGLYKEEETSTCMVEDIYRVPCGHPNITAKDCETIKCCYSHQHNVCFHYIPSKYFYTNQNTPSRKTTTLGRNAVPKMFLSIVEEDTNKVRIILHDSSVKISTDRKVENKNYDVDKSTDQQTVEIYRLSKGEKSDIILSTAKGPLIASDGYWEWTFQITNEKLFAFGEMFINLNRNSTFTKVIYKNKNDHSSNPIFLGYQKGKFSGLLVVHEGPLELTILPSNLVILRSLGGSSIELELFVGPTPRDVYNQQQKRNPSTIIPPLWALGVQLCRQSDVINAEDAIKDYQSFEKDTAGIESFYESDCFHENLVMMMQHGDKLDKIQEVMKKIKSKKKLLISLPPQILSYDNNTLYQNATGENVLYKTSNGFIFNGTYLKESVVYPDFGSRSADKYVAFLIEELSKYNIEPDGFVLNDNWPQEDKFIMDSSVEQFPYLSREIIEAMSGTLPWNATVEEKRFHYMKHNNYGTEQIHSLEAYFAATKQKTFIMSASYNYNGHPSVVENVNISWTNLKKSIKTAISQSIFGNHFFALPACGSTKTFNNKAMEELCLRWYIVAASMPIFRVSSEYPYRFPNDMYSKFTTDAILDTIANRNKLLPHFYTELQKNEPFLRPMFYDYYADNRTLLLDEQYMIGDSLLVAQPLLVGKTKLKIYLPPQVGVWYEFWGGRNYSVTKQNPWVNISVASSDWVSFIREEAIVPLVEPNSTGKLLNLVVALKCNETSCFAKGDLFIDPGRILFNSTEKTLSLDGLTEEVLSAMGCSENKQYLLNIVKIYGKENQDYLINKNLCNEDESATVDYTVKK